MKAIVFSSAMVMALLLASASATAGEQDFSLTNATGYTIDQFYVSSASTDDWEEDILGRDVLEDGETTDIGFTRESACMFDFKAVYTDGEAPIWYGIDLCSVGSVTLKWNASTQTSSIVTR